MNDKSDICDYCGKPSPDPFKLEHRTINSKKSFIFYTGKPVTLCPACLQKLERARNNAEADFYKQLDARRKKRAKRARAAPSAGADPLAELERDTVAAWRAAIQTKDE